MRRRYLLFFVLVIGLSPCARAQYYDFTVDTSAAPFVETVQQAVGEDRFSKVSRIYALTLAKTLGQLDRSTLSPEAFVEHLEEAAAVRNRFYGELNATNYQAYLLPIRIRSEYLTSAGWRKQLRSKVEPEITGITDPQQAATKVLAWCKNKVKLAEPGPCYPLELKGDLDPLGTLASGQADEIDLSILAVAALRSVGIVSRLVYTYAIAGQDGGKVWVEYRTNDGWKTWVASAPDGTDGKSYLLSQFRNTFTLILANPEQPINVTSSYVPTVSIGADINNALDKDRPGWNLLVPGKKQLMAITGRNIYTILPETIEVAPGNYIITAGDRPHVASLYPISIKAGQVGTYTLDIKAGTQTFDLTDQPAQNSNLAVADVQELDPAAVPSPALWK